MDNDRAKPVSDIGLANGPARDEWCDLHIVFRGVTRKELKAAGETRIAEALREALGVEQITIDGITVTPRDGGTP